MSTKNEPALQDDFEEYLKTVEPKLHDNMRQGQELRRNLFRISNSQKDVTEETVDEYLDMRSQLGATELRQCALVREIVQSKFDAGHIPKVQFQEENKLVQERQGELVSHQITITRKKRRVSNDILLRLDTGVDWDTAYVDTMLRSMGAPFGATSWTELKTRKKSVHQKWKEDVFKYYGAIGARAEDDPANLDRKKWCPVTQRYYRAESCKVAHIVPLSIGSDNAGYLFGNPSEGEDFLWDVANGLPLHMSVEAAFDQARIVIVPIENTKELKVIVLDETLLKHPDFADGAGNWRQVNGRPLKFLNDRRPRLRCLYFHFVTAMLRRERYQVGGWWDDQSKGLPTESIWASPGKYLRVSLLTKLASLVGATPVGGEHTFSDPETQAPDGEEDIKAMELLAGMESAAKKRVEAGNDVESDYEED